MIKPAYARSICRKLERIRRVDWSRDWNDIFTKEHIDAAIQFLNNICSYQEYRKWWVAHVQPQDYVLALICYPDKKDDVIKYMGRDIQFIGEGLKRLPSAFVKLCEQSDEMCDWTCTLLADRSFIERDFWWSQTKLVYESRKILIPQKVKDLLEMELPKYATGSFSKLIREY